MNFLFNKKQNKKTLILDIGSGSVGGAIVILPEKEEEVPVILKSYRFQTKPFLQNEIEKHQKETLKSIREVCNYLFKTNPGKIDQVFCVLTSPWADTESKKISFSNKDRVVFSEKMGSIILEKEIQKIKDLNPNKDLEVIEKIITEISIDGKQAQNPIGKKFNFLDININYSTSDKKFIESATDLVRRFFNVEKIKFRPFSILSFLMIRDNYQNHESHLLLDVGGEVTEVSLIKDGHFVHKKSFPFGKNNIIKHISLKLNIEFRDAEELFKLYYQNNISTSLKEKLNKSMDQIESFWAEEFKMCLLDMGKKDNLPKTIFLTIDNDMRNWFFGIFKNKNYRNEITFNNKFKVIILDENELINMCIYNEGVHDPFIMIEATALSRK